MNNTDEMLDRFPELILKLIEIRDALVRTSLSLQDWQFAMDEEAGKLARKSTDDILKRHGCHPGSNESENEFLT